MSETEFELRKRSLRMQSSLVDYLNEKQKEVFEESKKSKEQKDFYFGKYEMVSEILDHIKELRSRGLL